MAADCQGRLSPISPEILEDEALDPRIHVELERLNKASDEINKLELELDDERASFRQALSDTTHKLNALAKKLGSCVEKARPYYDQRHKVLEVHSETQKVALRFERACSMHEAAKEMVQLAEQGYMRGEASTDPAWQEMLNHATMKVNEAEKERNESETEHMKTMTNFQEADEKCQKLQKDLKRAIAKSRPYFELKAAVNQQMEDNKRAIKILEEDVHSSKVMYSEALRNLEKISDSIHQQRIEKQHEIELGVRGAGVGSETPSPPPIRLKNNSSIEGRNAVSSKNEDYTTSQTISGYQTNQYSLPSVIHESVERSRNQSYRSAIEHKASISEHDEFPIPSMESEFMSLPKNTSSKSHVHRKSIDRDYNSSSLRQRDSNSSSLRLRDSNSSSLGQRNSNSSSLSQRETENTKRSAIHDSITSDRRSSDFEKDGSPSVIRRNSKLKGGLILRIDSAMDPLTQMYQTQSIQPTRKKGKTHSAAKESRKNSKRSEINFGNSPENRSLPETIVTPTQSKVFSPPTNSPSHSSLSSALSVPDEDRSDAESIASTGPMLDDDQVGFLTMEFSEDVFNEEEVEAKTLDRKDSRKLSLPPTLSYLEKYIRQTSNEAQERIKSMDSEDMLQDSQDLNSEDEILQDTQHLNSEEEMLQDAQNLNSVDKILHDTQNLNSEDKILHDTQNLNSEDKILQNTQHLNSEDKILHDTQNLNSVDEILQDTQNLNSVDEILQDTQNLNSEDEILHDTQNLNSEDKILQDTQDVISGKLTESLDLQDSDTIDNQTVTTNDIIPNTISTTEEKELFV